MQPVNVLDEIRSLFEEKDFRMLISCLHEDALIWQVISDADFFCQSKEIFGNDFSLWNPAFLFLLFSKNEIPFVDVKKKDSIPIDVLTQQKAFDVFSLAQRQSRPPATFQEAGLIALILRDYWKNPPLWFELISRITPVEKSRPQAVASAWKTSFSILFGLIADSNAMVKSILETTTEPFVFPLVNHAILTQPMPETERLSVYGEILDGLGLKTQVALITDLYIRGYSVLAGEISRCHMFGKISPKALDEYQRTRTPENFSRLASRIEGNALEARSLQLAGAFEDSLSLLESVANDIQYLSSVVQLRISELYLKNGQIPQAMETLGNIIPISEKDPFLASEMVLTLQENRHIKEVLESLPDELPDPFARLKRANFLFKNEFQEKARAIGLEVFPSLLDQITQNGNQLSNVQLNIDSLSVLSMLDELGLKEEAIACAKAFLSHEPNNERILEFLGDLQVHSGNSAEARKTYWIASELSTQAADPRRKLARLLEESNNSSDAYQQWQLVVSHSNQPMMSDLLSLANSALTQEDIATVQSAVEKILEIDPDSPEAQILLGRAKAQMGDYEASIRLLRRALILTPDRADVWLELAAIVQNSGDNNEKLEILRLAAAALPDEPDVNLALGKTLIDQNLHSDSLSYLRKSVSSMPQNLDAVLTLSNVLEALGNLQEAKTVYERAIHRWPDSSQICFQLGDVLYKMSDYEDALPYLDRAIALDANNREWYLRYAMALLHHQEAKPLFNAGKKETRILEKVQGAFQSAYMLDPDNFKTRLFLAEYLILQDRGEEAIQLFEDLEKIPQSQQSPWDYRIAHGYGKACLLMGDTTKALQALNQSHAIQPDNIAINQDITFALIQMEQTKEAYSQALETLQIAPADVDNLIWFTRTMISLDKREEALDALRAATQFNPHRPDLLNLQAKMEIEVGEYEAAQKILQTLRMMPDISIIDLFASAESFEQLDDHLNALQCLEQILTLQSHPALEILFLATLLRMRMGDTPSAMQGVSEAIEQYPDSIPLRMVMAELFSKEGKYAAAIACVEHALQLDSRQIEGKPSEFAMEKFYIESSILRYEVLQKRELILLFFSLLHFQQKDLYTAQDFALRARELRPNDIILNYLTGEYSKNLLQNENISLVLQNRSQLQKKYSSETLVCDLAIITKVSTALDNIWQEFIFAENSQIPVENPEQIIGDRYRLLNARALIRDGKKKEAADEINQILPSAFGSVNNITNKVADSNILGIIENVLNQGKEVAALEAIQDLGEWNEVIDYCDRFLTQRQNNSFVKLLMVKAIVSQAEHKQLCDALKCQQHAPGIEVLGEERITLFSELMHSLEAIASGVQIERWKLRGEAVFKPSLQVTRAMMKTSLSSLDAASLIAALRYLNNTNNAIQIAERFKENDTLLIQVALCYATNEPEKGRQVAQRAVDLKPKNPLALVTLALLSQLSGDLPGAMSSLDKALEIWPDEEAWRGWLCKLAEQSGKYQIAIRHYEKFIAVNPARQEVLLELGRNYLLDKNAAKAVEFLEKYTRFDPSNFDAWTLVSQAYLLAGRRKEALESARKMIAMKPDSPQAYILCARIALQMNDFANALQWSQQALKIDPKNSEAISLVVKILVKQDKLLDALHYLEQCDSEIKDSYAVQVQKVELIEKIHGTKAALASLQDLVSRYPDEPKTLAMLAEAQMACGNPGAAERTAYTALRIDPEQPRIHSLLGRMMLKAGQLDKSIHHLSEAVQLNHKDIETYLDLGIAFSSRREYLKALQTFQEAIKIAPRDHRAYFLAAQMLRDSKDYIGAENMLRRASELAPNDINIRRQLGAVIALNLVHNTQEVKPTL